ncbi:MAG: SDR family oxidoreductase [Syntrophobacteraceae bacterium]
MEQTVFVTGATGFIGRHLVVSLLERGCHVFALVRAGRGLPAARRLARILEITRGMPLSPEMTSNLEVIEGDLVAPYLGLNRGLQQRLAAEIGQIFHCGGDIRFQPEDRSAYRAVHLDGPTNVLRAMHRGRELKFHHISTAYVAGRRSGIAYEEELDLGQTFRNPYEQIKLKAEQCIRKACLDLGVHLAVFRPSIVVADPNAPLSTWFDPISARFADFARLCRLYRRRLRAGRRPLRIRGSGESSLNIVPVTYVVRAMLEASDNGWQTAATYHLVDSTPPKNCEVIRQVMDTLGISGLEPFEDRRLPMAGMTFWERKLDNLLRPYRDYLFETPVFDDSNARRLLSGKVEPRSGTALSLLARAAAHNGGNGG